MNVFHKWVSDPSDFIGISSQVKYIENIANLVNSVLQNAKMEANFNKLRKTASTKSTYRT